MQNDGWVRGVETVEEHRLLGAVPQVDFGDRSDVTLLASECALRVHPGI